MELNGTKGQHVEALLTDIKACSKVQNLEWGKKVHAEAVESGHDSCVYVASALINMYAKCGSMLDARHVFNSMTNPNVVSWTALILGYADNGQGLDALELFKRMRNGGPAHNSVTLVAVLKACTSLGLEECRNWGKMIHNLAVEIGCNSDIYVQSILIDMYSKCNSIEHARQVFDSKKDSDVFSWTALILGYAENGQGFNALNLFRRMRTEGPAVNYVTFVAALKACTSLAGNEGSSRYRDFGKRIHNLAVESGCTLDIHVQNTLIDMYSNYGSMADALYVFEIMTNPNVASWTALILGYAEYGQGLTALALFARMRSEGPPLDYVVFVAAIRACTSLALNGDSGWVECRDRGKALHNLVVNDDFISSIYVQNTLVDMYAKCGSIVDARKVFDSMRHPDVVSWNALILGYAEIGEGFTALDLFMSMSEGPAADSVTFVAALKACTSLALQEEFVECRDRSKALENLAVDNFCASNIYVQNSLIGVYAKCRSMVDARQLFDSMQHPDVVSWNTLILGYTEIQQGLTVLDLFMRMKSEGPVPDSVTFMAVLKACGLVGALELGRTIHSELTSGNGLDVVLVTCLVDFYAKCGSLLEAKRVFELHHDKTGMITWNALLTGFSNCGDTKIVFGLFERMQDAGFRPDNVTFLCLLMCCSHSGLVEKGKEFFEKMPRIYGIVPAVEHYTCMMDIFGRSNKLDDAMGLLEHMPCTPDDVTWTTILGACRKWKNVDIGRLAFQSLINFSDKDGGAYVLMGQIYGTKGMLQEQEIVMKMQKMLNNVHCESVKQHQKIIISSIV